MKTHEYGLTDFLERSSDSPLLLKKLKEWPKVGVGGPWIAGGALRRSLVGGPLNTDVDYFFADESQRKSFEDSLPALGWKPVRRSESVSTWTKDDEPKLQCVAIAYYSGPESVIDSFDFSICQFVTDGIRLWCGEHSLWDLARKRLVLHKLTYGVATMRRLLKYMAQGFTACGGVMADILEAASDDPSVIHRETMYVD